MPNWCENILKINGIKKDIEKFYNENKNEDENEELDFYKCIPMPDKIFKGNLGIEERKLYGDNNWYDFNIKNFGTKWNVSDAEFIMIEIIDKESAFNTIKTIYLKTMEKDHTLQLGNIIKKFFVEHEAKYNFLTAWSPPISWVAAISEKYPNLKFTLDYVEYGCDFRGTETFENGELTNQLIETIDGYIYKKNKSEIDNFIKCYLNNTYPENSDENIFDLEQILPVLMNRSENIAPEVGDNDFVARPNLKAWVKKLQEMNN